MAMIEIKNLNKYFGEGENQVHILKDINLSVEQGDFIAIIGQSGSGKSTLMNAIGCLDTPSSGSYQVDGIETLNMAADDLAALRRKKFGFIFQRYNLLSSLNARDNVALPAVYAGVDEKLRHERAVQLLTDLGLGDKQAWNLGIKGNNIVFKPTAKLPDTNLLIQTNKRSYAFSLSLKPVKNQRPTYILRFIYPDSKDAQNRAMAEKQAKALDKLYRAGSLKKAVHNQNYWAFGDKALTPTAAYDNGRFTYLSFDNGKELPMVYKVMEDGSEALLNTHMEDDVIVIHETAKKFVLRLGKSVLAIENRGFNDKGSFNRTGTDNNDSVRVTR